MVMYENDKGKFPDDPAALYPEYIDDVRVFKSTKNQNADVGFVLVKGRSSQEDARTIVAYEKESWNGAGRNLVTVGGAVMFVNEAEFQREIGEMEEKLK